MPTIIALAISAIALERARRLKAAGDIELARVAEAAATRLLTMWRVEHTSWKAQGRAGI
jgi:hypothetical protein